MSGAVLDCQEIKTSPLGNTETELTITGAGITPFTH